MPRRLLRPLRRSGLDPVHRIGATAPDPVHRLAHMFGMNIWLVSGHEEAKAVLADQRRFSNDIRPYVGAAGASVGGLGFTDPPEHTRLRALLTPEFTMRRINRLAPRIEAIVDAQLDQMEANGPVVDLVEQFAFPIPFLVICELLGLPAEDRARFQTLSHARFDVTAGGAGAFGAISQSQLFLLEATRKQRVDPGDGLLGPDPRGGRRRRQRRGGRRARRWRLHRAATRRRPACWPSDRWSCSATASTSSWFATTTARSTGSSRRCCATSASCRSPSRGSPRRTSTSSARRIRKGDVVIAALSRADRDHRDRPRPRHLRPEPAAVSARRVRLRLPPVRGGRAGPPGAADRLPPTGPPFPGAGAGRGARDAAFRDQSIVYAVDSLPVHLGGASGSSNAS